MNPKFQIFTGLLKAYEGEDGSKRFRTTASSTISDLAKDEILVPAIEEMATKGGSIELANDDMGVHPRVAFFESDIAHERQDLHLLIDTEPPVFPPRDVEETEHSRPQRTDSREVRA